MVTLNTNLITRPGVTVIENTAGLIPTALANFRTCYILVTSTTGPYNIPVQVVSPEDFTAQFGSSTSLNAINLFFRNHPYGVLYAVRCKAPDIEELTITNPVEGVFSLTVQGQTVSYTATAADIAADDPVQAVIDGIITAVNINANLAGIVLAYDPQGANATFRIKILDPDGTLTVAAVTPPATATFSSSGVVTDTKDDFIYGIENAFDAETHEQGFLIAPQAFQTIATQSDRQAVGVSMQNWCEQGDVNWMALVEGHGTTNTEALAIAEKSLYAPAKGHLAFYYPYVEAIDVGGSSAASVPPSPAVAAVALRRYTEQGFQEPPAGILYPLAGVTDATIRVVSAEHAVLNSNHVNVIRRKPNRGVIIDGARTASASEYYRFVNTRVILNVISGTFKVAFDEFVFSAIDGQGLLFKRIKDTARAILYRLWRGKALYGATPTEAYHVVMDERNNPALDLEQGVFRMDVYAVPVPTGERFIINLSRTAIGQIDLVVNSLYQG